MRIGRGPRYRRLLRRRTSGALLGGGEVKRKVNCQRDDRRENAEEEEGEEVREVEGGPLSRGLRVINDLPKNMAKLHWLSVTERRARPIT